MRLDGSPWPHARLHFDAVAVAGRAADRAIGPLDEEAVLELDDVAEPDFDRRVLRLKNGGATRLGPAVAVHFEIQHGRPGVEPPAHQIDDVNADVEKHAARPALRRRTKIETRLRRPVEFAAFMPDDLSHLSDPAGTQDVARKNVGGRETARLV